MVMDGLSLSAWMARGDTFAAVLVTAVVVWTPLVVALIGFWRFATGGALCASESSSEMWHGSAVDVVAGFRLQMIAVSGLVAGLLSHFVLAMIAVAGMARGRSDVRTFVILGLVVIAYVAMMVWYKTLMCQRLYCGTIETRERRSFWVLFSAEPVLAGTFLFGG